LQTLAIGTAIVHAVNSEVNVADATEEGASGLQSGNPHPCWSLWSLGFAKSFYHLQRLAMFDIFRITDTPASHGALGF